MVVNLILLVDVCIIMVKQQWQTLFVDYYVSEVKSSLFRRQETAKRPCGHLGQTAPFSNT